MKKDVSESRKNVDLAYKVFVFFVLDEFSNNNRGRWDDYIEHSLNVNEAIDDWCILKLRPHTTKTSTIHYLIDRYLINFHESTLEIKGNNRGPIFYLKYVHKPYSSYGFVYKNRIYYDYSDYLLMNMGSILFEECNLSLLNIRFIIDNVLQKIGNKQDLNSLKRINPFIEYESIEAQSIIISGLINYDIPFYSDLWDKDSSIIYESNLIFEVCNIDCLDTFEQFNYILSTNDYNTRFIYFINNDEFQMKYLQISYEQVSLDQHSNYDNNMTLIKTQLFEVVK